MLSTDASGVAWGAHIHGKWKSTRTEGQLLLDKVDDVTLTDEQPVPTSLTNQRGGFAVEEQAQPIHILEYKAVFNALQALGPNLQDCCIRLWCDNTVVVQGLKNEFSKSPRI